MAIADVTIIVLVALCALFGLLRGMGKSTIGLFAWVGTFIAAILLTRYVAYALLDVDMVKTLVFGTSGFSLYSLVEPFSTNISADGIMGSIFAPILEPVAANFAGAQMETAGAVMVTYALYSAVICILSFIAIRIVMMLVTFILKKIFLRGEGKAGPVSRLLGFVVNGAKGAVITVVLFIFASFAIIFPFASFVQADIDKSFIAKPLFNFIAPYSSQMIADKNDMEGTIKDIVLKSGVLDSIEEEYVMYFDSHGGTGVLSQAKPEGGEIVMPDEPQKDGYVFEGWYFDDVTFELPVSFPYTMPGNNMTVHAKWISDSHASYTVMFVTNGANESVDAVTRFEGTNLTMPTVTKDGMVLDGWYYDDGIWLQPVGSSLIVSEHATVYAKWLSEEVAVVVSRLKGQSSILYTIAGVSGDAFDAVYWHDAFDADVETVQIVLSSILSDIARNAEALNTTGLASLQGMLADDEPFYGALEVYLEKVEALMIEVEACGGIFENINSTVALEHVNAGVAFTDETIAIYNMFGWTLPGILTGNS